MGTKKDLFPINQMKDILQIDKQSITNFFNSTVELMDKNISDIIGENAVLKNEVAELKKSLQFHTDQWEENFKRIDNLNELLQNQKRHQQQQQQPVIPNLKEIKDRLNNLENLSLGNSLWIDGIIKEEKESWS